ncbi:hypothetical protein [Oceanobacillus piezotolerans]|nr:hypothetical protein [Oceanobacillus piezotolerans]
MELEDEPNSLELDVENLSSKIFIRTFISNESKNGIEKHNTATS